jgi:type 1 fimbria pilin
VGSATPRSEDWIDIGEEKLRFKAMYSSLDHSDSEKATAGNFEAAVQFTVVYQ